MVMTTMMITRRPTASATGTTTTTGPSSSRPAHGPISNSRAFAVGIGAEPRRSSSSRWSTASSRTRSLCSPTRGTTSATCSGSASSWGATALASLKPSTRRTFGFRRTTIVASVANALILLFVTGGLTWESIRRLVSPEPTAGRDDDRRRPRRRGDQRRRRALLFMSQGKRDLNLRSAFVHLASDAVLALGVAVAGGIILMTGWLWLDPGGEHRPRDHDPRRARGRS